LENKLKFDHPAIHFFMDPSPLRRKFGMQVVATLTVSSTEEAHDCSWRHIFPWNNCDRQHIKMVQPRESERVSKETRQLTNIPKPQKKLCGHELMQRNSEHHFCKVAPTFQVQPTEKKVALGFKGNH